MDSSLQHISRTLDTFLRPEHDPRQARKRERILAAATSQFIQHGYRKTSMEAVAQAAGVAKGTIYLYYRTKAELLFHAITFEKQRYLTRLAPLGEEALSPLERLHGYIVLGLVMSRSMALVTRMISGDHEFLVAMEEVDAELLERVNRLQIAITVKLIDEATERSWPRRELERRAKVLIDLMYAVMTSGHMIQQPLPIEEYAQTLADIVVLGVLERSGPRLPFEVKRALKSTAAEAR